MKMEQTECSETLAFKLQTPGKNPEESIESCRKFGAYYPKGQFMHVVVHPHAEFWPLEPIGGVLASFSFGELLLTILRLL
jgi:hypothetical protein